MTTEMVWRRGPRRRWVVLAAITLAAVASGCGDGDRPTLVAAPPTTAPVAPAPPTTVAGSAIPLATDAAPVPGATTPPITAPVVGTGGPRVLLVGDSSMAGLRWYTGVADDLTGAQYTVDVESCRRVVQTSCIGREDRIPSTVAEVLAATSPGSVDVLVVMAGYNDAGDDFGDAIGIVGSGADALGVPTRVWMRLTTPNPAESQVDTAAHNRWLDQVVGQGWMVADWPRYAAASQGVFEADGIHLTGAGARLLAGFVSDVVATVSAGCTAGEQRSECPAAGFVFGLGA